MLLYCFMYFPLFEGVLYWSLFWYVLIYVLSSFTIILKRKRDVCFLLFFGCLVAVNVL